jgi:RimJ/RimL family protein N-acetyltransferase
MWRGQTSAVIGVGGVPARRFSVRPLTVGDRDALANLFGRLSVDSRRLRYLSAKPRLSERELCYLTDVDHVTHEALAAVDAADGSIVGVARYARYRERPAAAEVAIEVADEFHRRGIGVMLARALIARAHENGLAVLSATTLWENDPARALARQVGFLARASLAGEIALELYLPKRAAAA